MAKTRDEYLPLSTLGVFPAEWQRETLASVCVQVTDGTHDSPKPVLEGGFPLVTGKAIKDRRIDFSITYNISDDEHRKVVARSKAEPNDILFANIGNSIGDLVRVRTNEPFSIKNVALFKPDQKKIDPRYLEYFLLSEQVQSFIKGSTRGSAQPFIGLSSLRGFPIALPSMIEQSNIGALLGAFDDRIALLRETNATLMAVAKALFKSWFVDFDPIRAKQEGCAPEGMDEATAALFPDGFEESELGLVPKGWCVSTIGEIADVIDCLHSKKPELLASGHPYLQLNNIRDDGLLDTSNVAFVSEADYSKWTSRIEVCAGDCVITNVGRVGAVAQIPEGFRAAIGRNMTAIRLKSSWPYPTYLVELMQSAWMREEINKRTDVGTILNALNVRNIPLLRNVRSPHSVTQAFEAHCRPLRAAMEANLLRASTLANLRDTLLPRLISGQLRLPEAAALVA